MRQALLRTTLVVALVALVAPASAAGGEWTTDAVPGPVTFTVPDDVFFLTIDAQGGQGGYDSHTGPGGMGGGVRTTFPVTPGEELTVFQGAYGDVDGGGGFGGTGGGFGSAHGDLNVCNEGRGGGGASAVVRGSAPLVVAGGGGGAGGDCPEDGGRGGDGGNPPQAGHDAPFPEPPDIGVGGLPGGAWGTGGEPGHDATYDEQGGGGGGGGAGYRVDKDGGVSGGGGGGHDGTTGWKSSGMAGGGGAGGFSYVASGGMADDPYHPGVPIDGGHGRVVLSWGGTPAQITALAGSGQRTTVGSPFPAGLLAQVKNEDGVPIDGVHVRFSLPTSGASGSFAGGATNAVATTGPEGIAAAPPLTANAIAGSWSAVASVDDKLVHFTLGNDPAETGTAITSSADPTVSGQPVEFTAHVVSAMDGAPPTGAVQFLVDGVPAGLAPLGSDGRATSPAIDTLGPGVHQVKASYPGDEAHAPSSATLDQHVGKAASALALSSSLNPSGSGDEVFFTARVAPQPPGAGTPTGTVRFRVGDTDLGEVDVDADGTAVSPVASALAIGRHEVTATYAGDARVLPSAGSLVQSVGEEAVAVEVSSSVNPTAFGEPFALTAAVRRQDPGIVPTGTVTFRIDDREVCGPTELVDARASCPVDEPLPPGAHAVRVGYDGRGDYEDSVGALTQHVSEAATATTLTVAPEPSTFGGAVRAHATVARTAPGEGVPGGVVRFVVDGTPAGDPVQLVDGEADSEPIATLEPGQHVVEARYHDTAAVGRFADSRGATIHRVAVAPTATTLTSDAEPASAGAPVSFTARVAVPGETVTPTGAVQFLVDDRPLGAPVMLAGGVATSEPAEALGSGRHEVTAHYHGSLDFLSSDARLTQTVAPAPSGGGGGGGAFSEGSSDLGPAGLAPPLVITPPEPPARVEILTARPRVDRRGTARISVRCAGAPGQRCAGRLELRADRGRAARRDVTIATRTVSLPAGTTRRLRVDLNRAGERIVSAARRTRAVAAIVPDGRTAATEQRLRLRSFRAPALRVLGDLARAGRRGRVALRVRCAARRGRRCHGSVALVSTHGRTLGRTRVSVPGHRTRTIRVRLTAAARTSGALRATARAVSRIPVGRTTVRRHALRIRTR